MQWGAGWMHGIETAYMDMDMDMGLQQVSERCEVKVCKV